MATIEECHAALARFSDALASADGDVREAAALDRSVTCHLTDLDTTFVGRVRAGAVEVRETLNGPPRSRAEIRLALSGDDLVALVNGDLHFAKAWAAGRVRLEASILDLFRLRKLLR
ncbi:MULTISPECIES: sterol-binding protein [unclassified Streptomyces]|uniref:sterol-binding protein n=1 Tax=unclassified Streptomyces TaxID=2593676 RepID=UPI0019058955|nr:sterol-binding protein [Streptomyces sp. HSG2]